jgi:hypothetical protein
MSSLLYWLPQLRGLLYEILAVDGICKHFYQWQNDSTFEQGRQLLSPRIFTTPSMRQEGLGRLWCDSSRHAREVLAIHRSWPRLQQWETTWKICPFFNASP